VSCGVGCRRSSDPVLLWLWRRPVATAPIRPLAWESPYAAGAAQRNSKKTKQTNKQKKNNVILSLGEDVPVLRHRRVRAPGPESTQEDWSWRPGHIRLPLSHKERRGLKSPESF